MEWKLEGSRLQDECLGCGCYCVGWLSCRIAEWWQRGWENGGGWRVVLEVEMLGCCECGGGWEVLDIVGPWKCYTTLIDSSLNCGGQTGRSRSRSQYNSVDLEALPLNQRQDLRERFQFPPKSRHQEMLVKPSLFSFLSKGYGIWPYERMICEVGGAVCML